MIPTLRKKLKKYLITGTVTLVPLTITYVMLNFLFQKLDRLLMPFIIKIIRISGYRLGVDFHIPGIGFLATLTTIIIVGMLMTNLVGRKLLHFGERTLVKIPLVSNIYFGSKQLVEAFSQQGTRTFHQVVMVEYPRRGLYSIGLMTKETAHVYREGEEPMVTIFMPTTPNPTSGILILVRRDDVYPLPITVEDGIKFVVSGGIILPRNHLAGKNIGSEE